MHMMQKFTGPPSTSKNLKFFTESEPWGEYTLEDGSVVRVRLVLMRVCIDMAAPKCPDGTIRYMCQFQQVMDVEPSPLALETYKGAPNAQ